MTYNSWKDWELYKHVEAERSQRTANDSTSPQQSMSPIQNGPVVMEPPATYGDATNNDYSQYGDATTDNYSQTLHYMSEPDLSQPNIGSHAAGQYGPVVAEPLATYGDAATDNYSQTPYYYPSESCLSQADIRSDAAGQSPRDVPFDYVFLPHEFPKKPEPGHPVHDHKSDICEWHDGNGICGQTVKAGSFADHMSKYHFTSPEPLVAGSQLRCQWHGCQRSDPYRRDTINRHLREVHLKMSRSKSLPGRSIRRPRNTQKAHTTN
ncbi:hypothetical protein AZE42_06852 [Rhizopogon vesiculosus]|uniref:Uncharacterized protein n=1 Tax=Rhizopogon vesiculosus TaxID=180088 RepID=A0A1J8PPJ9_9AGAM|nr:hypothetical protein AZE42_06852 [Rhizopogon vesiculosus]